MREYKLRAWDRFKNKMIENILTIKFDRITSQPCLIVHTNKKINSRVEIREQDKEFCNEFQLMQYIDSKDKNRVEICEGDIVKNYTEIEQPQGLLKHTFIGKIVIERGMTYIIGRIKQEYNGEVIIEHHRVLAFSPEIFEVIGNIYENSELLEIE